MKNFIIAVVLLGAAVALGLMTTSGVMDITGHMLDKAEDMPESIIGADEDIIGGALETAEYIDGYIKEKLPALTFSVPLCNIDFMEKAVGDLKYALKHGDARIYADGRLALLQYLKYIRRGEGITIENIL